MNPYLILGVATTADDQQIRKAYLEGIKEATPDTHPQRFKMLNQAYEQIKDEPSRFDYYLFNRRCTASSPVEAFLQYARLRAKAKPLPFDAMKEFLRSCSKT